MNNYEFFIAKRLHFADKNDGRHVSRPAVRIAVIGIAVGLAVMIVAVSVVIGFKTEVRNQVIGFGSHIQITAFGPHKTFEHTPMCLADTLQRNIAALPHVRRVQNTAVRSGIIKTDQTFQGVVLKGVDSTYSWEFFGKNMVAGDTLSHTSKRNSAIISRSVADALKLAVGDEFITYFVDEYVRARKFHVTGIYETTFAAYDKLFIFTNIDNVRQLNGWDSAQVSAIEVLIDDFDYLDKVTAACYAEVGNRFDANDMLYQVNSIRQLEPQIFDWLDLLDMNAVIILVLMLMVAGFNMISGLLILILERTQTIGLLKALGARNWPIRRIFLYHAAFLVGKGILWGNLIGVALVLLEHFTHWLPLDAAIYYVNYVPVALRLDYWLWLNLGTVAVSVFMLLLPSHLVACISPTKAMNIE